MQTRHIITKNIVSTAFEIIFMGIDTSITRKELALIDVRDILRFGDGRTA